MHNSNNSALSKDTIFGASNHTSINSVFSSTLSLEDISVAKAKEALSKKLVALKEAIQLSDKPTHKTHPNNITETPSFHEAKAESLELTDSAKETFTRIGERATTKSLNEQIEEARKHFKQTFAKQKTKRARKYNIPFDASNPTARLIDEALKSLVNNKAHSKPNNSREVAV